MDGGVVLRLFGRWVGRWMDGSIMLFINAICIQES